MSFPIPLPEPVARALAKASPDLITGIVDLLGKILFSPDPKDALARSAQVLAHDKGADAAVDALFAGKKRIAGTGE